jgi:hypothetical protein
VVEMTGGALADSGHGLVMRGVREQHGTLAKLLRRSRAVRRSPESGLAACTTWRQPWCGGMPACSGNADAVASKP